MLYCFVGDVVVVVVFDAVLVKVIVVDAEEPGHGQHVLLRRRDVPGQVLSPGLPHGKLSRLVDNENNSYNNNAMSNGNYKH